MGDESLNTGLPTFEGIQELDLIEDSIELDDIYIPISDTTVNHNKRQILSIIFIYLAVLFLSFASHSLFYTYIPYLVPKPSDVDGVNLFLLLVCFATAFVTGLFTDKHLHRYWLIISESDCLQGRVTFPQLFFSGYREIDFGRTVGTFEKKADPIIWRPSRGKK